MFSPSSPWFAVGFPLVLVALMLTGTWLLMSRRAKAAEGDGKLEKVAVPSTRFSDVAGADDAVAELVEIVDMMSHPQVYDAAGARRPHGVLLSGPPGTGKTLLARAVAGEAGVPFYAVSGSSFVEKLVGVGASRVRRLFKQAGSHPEGAIVFIDEVDAMGRARGTSDNTNEHEATLNELLVALDGFSQESKVMVLAATNMPGLLDPALTRPGRLERSVSVGLPDRRGRSAILATHVGLRDICLDPQVDLYRLASRTPGMSGAELERVVNEAALCAARRHDTVVAAQDLDSAVATVTLGRESSARVVSDSDRLVTAWHEAGHAVAALFCPSAPPPAAVTILPRGPSGGSTHMHGSESMYASRSRCYAQLVVAMAGRAAEERLLDGEYTSGPSGDLASATDLAGSMVARFGMGGESLVSRSSPVEKMLASEPEFRAQVQGMLAEALGMARDLLEEREAELLSVVDALLEADTLDEAALYAAAGLEAPKVPPVG